MQQRIDEKAIVETWELLAPEKGHVRWATISREDPTRRGILHGSYAKSPYELVEFAKAYNPEGDFYVQLNPSEALAGHRVNSEQITEWRWFFVDLDPKTYPLGEGIAMGIANLVANALDTYLGGNFVPYVVDSGRGVQLWYRLKPESFTPTILTELYPVKKFEVLRPSIATGESEQVLSMYLRRAVPIAQRFWLERLQSRLPGDSGVAVDFTGSDLPRLARCPGTVNFKTGNLARILVPGKVSDTLAWKLLHYTPTDRYVRDTHAPSPTSPLCAGASWQAAVAFVNPTAAAFLSVGVAEPGRHEKSVAAARSLAEAGIGEEQIVKGLEWGGTLCRPPLEDREYFERVAREAVKRVRPT